MEIPTSRILISFNFNSHHRHSTLIRKTKSLKFYENEKLWRNNENQNLCPSTKFSTLLNPNLCSVFHHIAMKLTHSSRLCSYRDKTETKEKGFEEEKTNEYFKREEITMRFWARMGQVMWIYGVNINSAFLIREQSSNVLRSERKMKKKHRKVHSNECMMWNEDRLKIVKKTRKIWMMETRTTQWKWESTMETNEKVIKLSRVY